MANYVHSIIAKFAATGTGQFKAAFKEAETSVKSFSQMGDKISNVGQKMGAVGATLTKSLTLPLLAVGAGAVKTSAEFEKGMSEVKAVSGATGDEMQSLKKLAREMGATTKFSAAEAGDGLKYMAMAGWDVNQMTAGLPAVLDLAAASGEDLGRTSDIVTDALTAFGLEAKDAAGFADLLAMASNKSNTDVSMLGESFKYVAPVMGALGVTTEDTALALGLMANAGIKGGQAGTSLRKIMTSLIGPTDEAADLMEHYGIQLITNADGTVDLKGTMDNLRETMRGLDPVQQQQIANTVFGERAMSALSPIINATEEDYNDLADATTNYNGAAKDMADIMQDNLQGAWTILKSALSEAAISLGETLVPIIRSVAEWVQKWVDKFNALDSSTKEIIVKIGLWLAAIGPAFIIIGKLVTFIGKATTALAAMGTASTLAAGPIIALVAAVTAVVGALVIWARNADNTTNNTRKLRKEIEKTEKAFKSLKEELADNQAIIKVQTDRMVELANKTKRTAGEQAEFEEIIKSLSAEYPDLLKYINQQTGEYTQGEEALRAYINTGLEQDNINLLTEERTKKLAEQKKAEELLLVAKQELADAEARFAETGAILDYNTVTSKQQAVDSLLGMYDDQETGLAELDEKINEHALNALDNEEKLTGATAENIEARKNLKGEELLAYVAAMEGMAGADEEQAQNQIEHLEKQQAAYDAYYDNLVDKTADIYQKMGGLGDGAVKKNKLTAAQVRENLKAQIADWNKWQTGLAEIQGRVPKVMYDELSKMGPQGQALLDEYSKMTDEELSADADIYREKGELSVDMYIAEISNMPGLTKEQIDLAIKTYEDEMFGMEKTAAEFGQRGVDGFGSAADDFINAGFNMAKKAGDAMKIDLKPNGANFGQTFVTGIKSMEAAAYNSGYALGQAANRGQRAALSIQSPSRVARENAENFGKSFVDNLLKLKNKAFAAGREFTQAALNPLEQPVNVSMGYSSSLSSTGGRQSGGVEYGGGITQNITIQSPEPMSASDNARRIKQASRELALEW